MAKTYKIAVLPGDGIGPEVMKESLKTLEAAGKLHGVSFSFTEKPVGGAAIDLSGHEASVTVWDKEAVIYADLDMQKVPASRMELDCVGHYARPDVLELRVNEK